jgi:hypothetical protein
MAEIVQRQRQADLDKSKYKNKTQSFSFSLSLCFIQNKTKDNKIRYDARKTQGKRRTDLHTSSLGSESASCLAYGTGTSAGMD